MDNSGTHLIVLLSIYDDRVLLEIACFLFEDLKQMLATILLSTTAPYLPIEKFVHTPTLQTFEIFSSNQAYLSHIDFPEKDTSFFEGAMLDDDG